MARRRGGAGSSTRIFRLRVRLPLATRQRDQLVIPRGAHDVGHCREPSPTADALIRKAIREHAVSGGLPPGGPLGSRSDGPAGQGATEGGLALADGAAPRALPPARENQASRGLRQGFLVRFSSVGRRRDCMSMTLPVQIRRGPGQGALYASPARTAAIPATFGDVVDSLAAGRVRRLNVGATHAGIRACIEPRIGPDPECHRQVRDERRVGTQQARQEQRSPPPVRTHERPTAFGGTTSIPRRSAWLTQPAAPRGARAPASRHCPCTHGVTILDWPQRRQDRSSAPSDPESDRSGVTGRGAAGGQWVVNT